MITASIVTYKSDRDELTKVLNCTCNSSISKVYIVDNSPNDELGSFSDFSPKIEYIHGQGNVGYGSGHNIAIGKACEQGATYHVVINPDIEFESIVIEQLAAYMDQHSDVGQIMPKIVNLNGDLQYFCKLLPTPMDLIGRRFVPIKSYIERRNYLFEMIESGYDKDMFVPFLSGCFMFMRVDALSEVGGFDDDFFMYCEDIDLCRRIGMTGYKTIYHPEVTVIHAHKKESFKSRSMLKAHIKSAFHYFNKWGWFYDSYRKKTNKKATSQYS